MSRSNIDKPFYVDIGTSIAAVRCQSNMDVLDRFDHVRLGKAGIEMAEEMCDRMNAEVDKFMAAKDVEIAELRECLKMAIVDTRLTKTCVAFDRECDTCNKVCDAHKWFKALKGANSEGK